MRFYEQFIRPNDICFDIGANMGNRTEVFLKLGAKVIAVEPQSECVNLYVSILKMPLYWKMELGQQGKSKIFYSFKFFSIFFFFRLD